MESNKPYKRTVRQLKDGSYANDGNSGYIKHPDYANSPEKYVRSFLLIQNDLKKLFEYIEPADKNKKTYSYRIHELFIRVCVEVEANCKAILRENDYIAKNGKKNWTMHDYCLIEKTHKLSGYKVSLPRWDGKFGSYMPFKNWGRRGIDWYKYYRELDDKKKKDLMSWYDYYNDIKHDIHSKFEHANIKNLVEATCGLVALLSSQFFNENFSRQEGFLMFQGTGDGMEPSIGGYFRVKYPVWNEQDRYDFDWQKLKKSKNPIQQYDYNSLTEKI